MNNLLKETQESLRIHGKNFKDIRFITNKENEIPLEVFKRIANRNYNDGFGWQNVNSYLKIVGDDWWLERHEYDGSEWWEFKTLPVKPDTQTFDANAIWDEL